MSVSFLRSWIYGSSDTTIDGTTATPQSTVTLSVTNVDNDNNDNDDDTPPAFPSLNSIQRSGPSISMSVSRSGNGRVNKELMPPPSGLPSRFNNTQDLTVPGLSSNKLSPFDSHSSSSSSSNSLQLPPSTIKPPTLTPKQRQKVALAPGHSTLDWAALKTSGKDLRGVPTLLRVTPSLLKLHRKPDDAWTAINGKVYNITPYLDFHPGGVKELMRVAGRDGTKLFASTHAWVNVEMMLDECMIGFLVPEPSLS
ncbi:hypothetical protein Clacol_004702 [Clathrus columnatus]|uniref:Cytochrome b5 heme-binding domain-containing protein n=1 Tax=Clathrus columnatus TaxID=1419009 RepID=A0AAV5ADA7_9AGAM|nr:hypothetical protein Clacol_004702 [Clathrus columnatus]